MIIRGYHAVTRKQVVMSQKTKGLFLIYEGGLIMNYIRAWLSYFWDYTVHHKWSKDILRANFLYVLIILLYSSLNLFYSNLHLVPWGLFIWLLFLLIYNIFFIALFIYYSSVV